MLQSRCIMSHEHTIHMLQIFGSSWMPAFHSRSLLETEYQVLVSRESTLSPENAFMSCSAREEVKGRALTCTTPDVSAAGAGRSHGAAAQG